MTSPPPIPDELWAKVPSDAQAAIAAVFLAMQQRVDELETRVRDLEARLQLNSTNSSKPPSSDPIGLKRKPPTPPTGRNRGGQPGHPEAFRPLVRRRNSGRPAIAGPVPAVAAAMTCSARTPHP